MAARRAMTLRMVSGRGATFDAGTLICPEKAGLYWVYSVCMWFSGSETTM